MYKSINTKNIVPLVVRYSWNEETPVWLFESEREAKAALKRDWKKECKTDIQENGKIMGKNMDATISKDGLYANIIWHYENEDDITEWFIGNIRN